MKSEDEVALDYSALYIEPAISDPEVNGFTALRALDAEITAIFPDDYEHLLHYDLRKNWDLKLFEGILAENADLLEQVESAFDLPVFRNDQPPTYDNITCSLGLIRNYFRLRIIELRVLQMQGDDRAAFDRITDLQVELERFLSHEASGLIGWLSSMAAIGLFETDLAEFSAGADLTSDQWKILTEYYDFHEKYPEAAKVAFKNECQMVLHTLGEFDKHPGAESAFPLIDEPSFAQRIAFFLVGNFWFKIHRTNNIFYRTYSEAIDQMDIPLNQRDFAYADAIDLKLENQRKSGVSRLLSRNFYGEIVLENLYPGMPAIQEVSTKCEASSRAMQIRLALAAYYSKFGELPDSLGQLVPIYLKSIPLDPFGGEPMRYSKERAIVYSVGNDFIDDGGSKLDFMHESEDEYVADDYAEADRTEPTFPIRFKR
ncbi:MAG: hypothetical protein ACSHYA_15680 [Opitutaceae bacterium]